MVAGWCALACLAWVLAGIRIIRNAAPLRMLRDLHPPAPAAWPTLSVLVPACNEAETLEPAMASLLAQDYPGLEIILVDDRSTDGTAAIVDRLAARDPRVVPLHVGALHDGWLGKVQALARARERARGDWLLCTDADVHFAPGALRQVVAATLESGAGHVAVIPAVPVRGFWLRTTIGAFSHALFLVLDGHRMGAPRSGIMMGVGACNLVRASDLDASPGIGDLRMEVIDDVGLAQMLNRQGTRGLLLGGAGCLSVAWYPTLGAMSRGLEKGAFAVTGFSAVKSIGSIMVVLAILGGLLAAPGVLPRSWGMVLACGGWAIYTAGGVAAARKMGSSGWLAPVAPLGMVVTLWISARSMWITLRRGGITWRGTFYPLAALRAGHRIRF